MRTFQEDLLVSDHETFTRL